MKQKRRVAGMSRQRSLLIAPRQDALLQRVQALTAEHPCWGYRRLWASLRFVEPGPVHKKRVWRLMREHHLVVPTTLQLKAKRTPTGSHPRATKPNAWGGSAMTTLLVEGLGGVEIVVVLEWATQTRVGDDAARPGTARPWLLALEMAVNHEVPTGARDHGVSVLSDHGCQPTSRARRPACQTLGVHQVLTSANNPQGQADTERRLRTRQAEGRWRQEWTSPFARIRALEVWMTADTTHDLHSSLGSQSPRQCARASHLSHGTPFVAA